jgi:predicted Fe-Mo cluster-binding NifX family protein
MKVIVSATESGLDAGVSSTFGRCPVYVLVDTETMDAESIPNPVQNAPAGAGIQAAQFVLSKNVAAILTGNVGPNAQDVLAVDGTEIYTAEKGTVRDAVEAFVDGHLHKAVTERTAAQDLKATGTLMSDERRQRELAALTSQLAELRKRLADIMTRIDNLQEEE